VTVATYVIPRPGLGAPARSGAVQARPVAARRRGSRSGDLLAVQRHRLRIRVVTRAGVDDYGTLTLPAKIGPRATVEAELVLKPEALTKDLRSRSRFRWTQVSDSLHRCRCAQVEESADGELVAPKE